MMRKKLFAAGLLSGLTLLPAGAPLSASAGSPGFSLTYELEADGSAAITGCTGTAARLVIPAELDGHPVRKIRRRAFGVSGPDLVKDSRCFCAAESLVIEEGITEIGIGAFENCKLLRSVRLPESLSVIKDEAFIGCDLLTEIAVGAKITRIGNYAVGYACEYEMQIEDGEVIHYSISPYLIQGFVLYGPKGLYADQFAELFEIPFGVTGDADGDGTLRRDDAVLLQNWLLCSPGAVPADWRAADLDRDRRLTAADLCLLKRMLPDE